MDILNCYFSCIVYCCSHRVFINLLTLFKVGQFHRNGWVSLNRNKWVNLFRNGWVSLAGIYTLHPEILNATQT